MCFPKVTTSLADGLCCVLQCFHWSWLCLAPRNPWPLPKEATSAAPLLHMPWHLLPTQWWTSMTLQNKKLLPAEYPLRQGATKGQGARSIRARLVRQGLSICPTRRRHLEAPGQPQPWHQAHSWDGARVRPVYGPMGWPGWVEHGGGEMALLEFRWGRGWWLQSLM